MTFGYFSTFQTLDKGLIEKIGPTGFSSTIYSTSSGLANFNNGFLYRAIFILLSFALLFLSFYLGSLFFKTSLINIQFLLFISTFFFVFLVSDNNND
jgi:hypothetical protein